MEAYLDNGATTKCFDEVIESMNEVLRENYGNPSSLHNKGIAAEKKVTEARQTIADILKVDKNEIYFTSGGTESNNLALIGIARAYNRTGKHIITASTEHPSVLATIKMLEEDGFEITILPVSHEGIIDIEALKSSIREDTILVSLMHVNNEIGSVLPLETIGKCIKEMNRNTVFHVDAIQSYGKYTIYPNKMTVDALSISAHKFHGPKGIGALYLRKGIKIRPLIYGGYQQKGLRSGTENVPGIVGLGTASKRMYENLEKHVEYIYDLKKYFYEQLQTKIEGVAINGMSIDEGAPHILNVRFEKIKSEVLLHALEGKGIYVSTGSACSSNKPEKSTTLSALGLSNEEIDNSVRFSFSVFNTKEELDYCVEVLQDTIPNLRKFVRR